VDLERVRYRLGHGDLTTTTRYVKILDEEDSAATCRYGPVRSANVTPSTRCDTVNMSMPEVTQRDLRSRSREIMDAVEHGQSFTVTRDGHQIGELVPIRRKRRFVSRQEFTAMSRNAPGNNLDAFRADQDAAADHEDGDPYER
jgi:antitoxin (DNA-binding transcriptional repressor) of toxin-antitoxin stability system